ncbi:MAG: hypothetical protein ACUVQP_08015 [Bacteroidales bacterium]
MTQNIQDVINIYKELQKELDEIKQRQLARRAVKNIIALANFVGYKDIDRFHYEFADFIQAPYQFKLALVPRHHLKTTLGNYVYSVQQILLNPAITILLVSSAWNLAQDFLAAIKKILESPIIENNYGRFVGDVWNVEKIIVAPAVNSLSDNTFTIETMGVDKGKTSKHYDIIIVDDIVERNNVESERDRQHVLRVFKDLFSLLKKPDGKMLVLGTRWHEDDLYNHIINNMGDTFKIFHRSCFVYPDGTPCFDWDEPKRQPIYPKKFTNEALDYERKYILGDYAFSLQMMNNPQANKSRYLKFDDIVFFTLDEEKNIYDKLQSGTIPQEQLAIIVDPSSTIGRLNDFTAIVAFWYDNHFLNLVDAVKFQAEPHTVVEAIVAMVLKTRIYNVYIEKGALESGIAYYLEQRLAELGLSDKVFVEGISHEGKRKETRILSIEPYLRRKQFRSIRNRFMKIRPNDNDVTDVIQVELRKEMDNFPEATHDDLTDAIGYAPKVFALDVNFFDFSLDKKDNSEYNENKSNNKSVEWYEDRSKDLYGINFDSIDFVD